jgi:hypothetical protein
MRVRTGATGVFVACALASVGVSAQPVSGRDSAGIRIVEVDGARLSTLPTWTVEGPTVTIGEPMGEPEYLLNGIGQVWRLSDGRIVIPNERVEIRFFDAKGKYLETVGRRGRGPGEYSLLQGLWRRPGDTLLAFDAIATRGSLSRIDVRDPMGRLVRAQPITGAAGIGTAWLPDGSALVLDYDPQDWSTVGKTERGLSVRRMGSGGELQDTVHRTRVGGLYIHTPGSGNGVRLGAGAFLSGGPQGAVFVHGSSFAIHWFDARGQLTTISRVPLPRERVTERDKRDADAAEAEALTAFRPLGRESAPRPSVAYAEFRPMVTRVRVDSDGNAWARRWSPRSARIAEWVVFAPSGAPIARVQLPAEFLANDIGRDYLLGPATDSDGVQSVRLYRLVRPASPR